MTSCGKSSAAAGASSIDALSSSSPNLEESGNKASARIWARRRAAWEALPETDADGTGDTSDV